MLPFSLGEGLDDVVMVVVGCLGVTTTMELRCAGPQLLRTVTHDFLQRVVLHDCGSSACGADGAEFSLAEAVRTRASSLESLAQAVFVMSLANKGVSEPNAYGQTALMWAAGQGSAPLCALLVAAGASLENVDSGGWTALFRASWHGQRRAAAVLLRAGADANTRKGRYTPLMAAARFGHGSVVEELLAAGADPSLETSCGETAQSLAKDQRHLSVASLLAGTSPGKSWAHLDKRHGVRGRWEAQREFEMAISGHDRSVH